MKYNYPVKKIEYCYIKHTHTRTHAHTHTHARARARYDYKYLTHVNNYFM